MITLGLVGLGFCFTLTGSSFVSLEAFGRRDGAPPLVPVSHTTLEESRLTTEKKEQFTFTRDQTPLQTILPLLEGTQNYVSLPQRKSAPSTPSQVVLHHVE